MMVIISNITKKHDNFCLIHKTCTHSLKNVHFLRQVEINTRYKVNIPITGIKFDDMSKAEGRNCISGILQ
jgi:hypothetical protein